MLVFLKCSELREQESVELAEDAGSCRCYGLRHQYLTQLQLHPAEADSRESLRSHCPERFPN